MLIQSDFIDLDTPTGVMRTYIHRPNSNGQFPVILFYSEIFQQTGPIERAAKIIASHGYAVLVPEVFHELNPIAQSWNTMMLVVKKAMRTRLQTMFMAMIRIIKRWWIG